jgi:hypothetical protein
MTDQGESEPEPVAVPATQPVAVPATEPARGPNTLAVVSLVVALVYFGIAIGLGIAGHTAPIWLAVLPVGGVLAGYVARGQTMRNGRGGSYLALIGLALGYIALALLAFGFALALLTAR